MTGNLDAFCERCGKTATSPVPAGATGAPKVLRRLGLGGRGRHDGHESSALRLCLGCRGYICAECWNDEAGVCQTCQPLAGVGVSVQHELPEEVVAPGFEIVDDTPPRPAPALDLAWPETDLHRAPDNNAEPRVFAEPDVFAEPAVSDGSTSAVFAESFEDRWAEIMGRIQAVGDATVPEPEATSPEPDADAEPVAGPVADEASVDDSATDFAAESEPELLVEAEPAAEPEPEPEPEPMFEHERTAVAEYDVAADDQRDAEDVTEAEAEPVAEVVAEEEEAVVEAEAEPVAEVVAEEAVVDAEAEPVAEVVAEEAAAEAEAEPVAEVVAEEAAAEVVAEEAAAEVVAEEAAAEVVAEVAVTSEPEEDLWTAVLQGQSESESDSREPDAGELARVFQPRRLRRRVARSMPRRPARTAGPAEAHAEPATTPELSVATPAPGMTFAEAAAAPESVAQPRVLHLPAATPPKPAAVTQPWPMPAPPAFLPPPPPPATSTVGPAPARFRPQMVTIEAPKPPATRPCGSCGLELSARVTFCRRCGTRQPPQPA